MSHKRWILAVLLAAVLLCAAGISFAAQARESPAQATRAAHLRDHVVQGEVVAIAPGEATVETGDGLTVTLSLADDTFYWEPGSPPTHTLALAVGDPVLALGRPVGTQDSAAARALDARVVVVVEPAGIPRCVVAGRVVAVTAQTVVVRTPRGERALTITSNTRLLSPQGPLDSLRDVRRGQAVIALGQPARLGQWIAGAVLATTAGGDQSTR